MEEYIAYQRDAKGNVGMLGMVNAVDEYDALHQTVSKWEDRVVFLESPRGKWPVKNRELGKVSRRHNR